MLVHINSVHLKVINIFVFIFFSGRLRKPEYKIWFYGGSQIADN